MRTQLSALGCKIKKIRKSKKMTLQELADKTALTAGLLSKIENFRTIPSLPVLLRICKGLETDLTDIVDGISCKESKNWILIRQQEQTLIERNVGHGLIYKMIFETQLNAENMQVMIVTSFAEFSPYKVSTDADQLVYVLSGKFDFILGNEKITLNVGDFFFFDGTIPHCHYNGGNTGFKLLVFYFIKGNNRKKSTFFQE